MTSKRPNISDKEVIDTGGVDVPITRKIPGGLEGTRVSGNGRDEETEDDQKDPTSDIRPDAPTNLEIVEQTIRYNEAGWQLIDVVLEFDEVGEAVQYEVKIARADA